MSKTFNRTTMTNTITMFCVSLILLWTLSEAFAKTNEPTDLSPAEEEALANDLLRIKLMTDELLRSKSLAELERDLVPKLRQDMMSDDFDQVWEANCILHELSVHILDEFPELTVDKEDLIAGTTVGQELIHQGRFEDGLDVLFREAMMMRPLALDTLREGYLFGLYETKQGEDVEVIQRNDPRILDLFRTLAKEGHPDAKEFIGIVQSVGAGVPRDEAGGRKLLEEPISLESMQYLADYYCDELGEPEKADPFYRRLAFDHDCPRACHRLAQMVAQRGLFGEGVALLHRAQKLAPDYSPVRVELAYMYIHGFGVEPDLDYAENLAKQVLKNEKNDLYSRALAEYHLGTVATIRREPTENQLKKEFEQAQKNAESGNADAMVRLGQFYLEERVVEYDAQVAQDWFRKAADQGNSTAMYYLGLERFHGILAPSDQDAGLEWLHRAAEAGSAEAMFLLGTMYAAGTGVELNVKKAMDWYRKAATAGHTEAMGVVGGRLLGGFGVEKDVAQGVEWCRKGALNRDAASMALLGTCYAAGIETEADLIESYIWCSLAIRFGMMDAYEQRVRLVESLTPEQLDQARTLVEERFQSMTSGM